MPRPAHHQLQRSLSKLAIGVARDFEDRRARNAELGLQEIVHQIQIPIQGTAFQGITWAKKHISFDVAFYEAPSQRDSNFDRPHFGYGVVTEPVDVQAVPVPVVVTAMFEFELDDRGATKGGWLHVGIHSPTPDPRDFQGSIHLTFQGFGAAQDDTSGGEL